MVFLEAVVVTSSLDLSKLQNEWRNQFQTCFDYDSVSEDITLSTHQDARFLSISTQTVPDIVTHKNVICEDL